MTTRINAETDSALIPASLSAFISLYKKWQPKHILQKHLEVY